MNMIRAYFTIKDGQDFVDNGSFGDWLISGIQKCLLWLWQCTVSISHWAAAILLVYCAGMYFINRDKRTARFAYKVIFIYIFIRMVDMVI